MHVLTDHVCSVLLSRLAQVETWSHRHLPDPRLLLDGDNFLPCQIAARRQYPSVAHMLLPSNPIGPGDLNLVGPPTLAAIAGAVLRSTLSQDLGQLLQKEQEGRRQRMHMHSGSSLASVASTAEASDAAACSSDEGDCFATDEDEHEVHSPAGSAAGDDAMCGVCFDAPAQVALAPCGHQLCTSCCKSLLDLNSRCVMQCPFCRGGVGHLAPIWQPAERPSGAVLVVPSAMLRPAAAFTHSATLVV